MLPGYRRPIRRSNFQEARIWNTPPLAIFATAILYVQVHKGFLTAYDTVRSKVASLLDFITADGSQGEWRVYVTGHSLGGALATLCAYELATRE